ncbi:MAG: fructosamine kinase family protein [Bacteroidota bacterium]
MALPAEIQQEVSEWLQCQVISVHPLGGGCIHHAQRVETAKGIYFIKYNQVSQAHNFEVEAKGLELLRSAQALRIPELIRQDQVGDYAYLILEFVESGARTPKFWEQLGHGLGQLHQRRGEAFGLKYDNYIGALPQINTQKGRWLDFFRECRLRPMVELAERKGQIDASTMHQFDQLYERLPVLFPEEAPVLLHGDLWGGNLMTGANGEPVLIDPAVYYGHREMELAFMTMFDSQPESFYEAYEEVYPLEEDWEDRIPLCNLYPLMVHVNLFGGSYLGQVKRNLRELLK